ncbi:MAG TPA: hypothetical protein VMT18_08495 [Planctomycetota bacterium]|nr:hypothetical protein [Planctomycetota bacterium]
MSARDEALLRIAELARQHGLSPDEVRDAVAHDGAAAGSATAQPAPARPGVLARVAAWLGGTLVLAGVCVLVGMLWGDLGFVERVLITLGTGLIALVLSYMASLEPRRERLVTPLYLIAALTQPIGLLVILERFSSGSNEALGALAVAGVLAVQGALFATRVRRSAVVFATLAYGAIALSAALSLLDVDEEFNATVVGLALFLVAWGLTRTPFEPITPFWFGTSASIVLLAWFAMARKSPGEVVGVLLIAVCIWLSTLLRSRTLLAIGTLALVIYVGDLSGRYFVDSLGWPILLIGLGALLMGAGTAAVRIHRRYIRPAA